MENTVFVYGIAAVIMLMVGSLVGMALCQIQVGFGTCFGARRDQKIALQHVHPRYARAAG